MRRANKIWIALGALTVLSGAAVALVWLGKGKATNNEPTVKVTRGDLTVIVAETGTIQPLTKVEIKSRIAGQVARVLVEVGDRVRLGQELLQLDTGELARNRMQASVDLEVAKIRLAKLKAGARPEEIAEARAEVQQVEAEHQRARSEYRRTQLAASFPTLTPRELDTIRSELAISQARLAAMRARWAKLLAGPRSEDLAEATAQLTKAVVAFKAAEDQLAYAIIRSPLTGVVIKRGIEAGEMVTPGISATAQGTALLTIADLGRLIITSNLNQIDIGKVRRGQHVEVRVDSAPGRLFHGKIRKVAPAADTGKNGQDGIQTFACETILTDPDNDVLKPGMTADLDISSATRRQTLYLPVEAIVRGKGDAGTVTLSGKGKVKADRPPVQKIKIGLSNDQQIEVIAGLFEGQEVLVKPPPAADNSVKF
ncbi:MAG: efflux RND transporter periplasmic adaptor subunit [Cyanobacteria bacterium NC_groundwater_1444_Ag_S-0.65um_54_12]|nr:efflux RND transporter periplasmic adaptor subunit [Cyanobacteria bacterium NC_groundwater_1444_Ag_S-0.65um_54_12]